MHTESVSDTVRVFDSELLLIVCHVFYREDGSLYHLERCDLDSQVDFFARIKALAKAVTLTEL